MKREEIRIGETYRIREWDDLAAEYGVRTDGNNAYIKTPCRFFERDRHICGEEFTVKQKAFATRYVSGEGLHFETIFLSVEGVEKRETYFNKSVICCVTAEMLEPFDAHKEAGEEFTAESILDFLFDRKEKSC